MTNITDIRFIDIETVPVPVNTKDERTVRLLKRRYEKEVASLHTGFRVEDVTVDMVTRYLAEFGGLSSEFGKIVSFSSGHINSSGELHIHSWASELEHEILDMIVKVTTSPKFQPNGILCAHNGREFDFPYIFRRLLVHGIDVPYVLDVRNKKPWEITNLDTMQLYAGGQFNHRASLDLLSYMFGLPSPKTELSGSAVGGVYYGTLPGYENMPLAERLSKISHYCSRDVSTLANVYLKMCQKEAIPESRVYYH